MNTHVLYLPLNKKETHIGWFLALLYVGSTLPFVVRQPGVVCLVALAALIAAVFFMREFFSHTCLNLLLLGRKVWILPPLAALLNLVVCTVFNDLALFYGVGYFVNSGWGPAFWNVQAYNLHLQPNFWLIATAMVLVVPIVEELIFRQWIFSLLYPKSRSLAVVVSVLLFVLFQTAPFASVVPDPVYWGMYAFQFIPMGIFLCWIFISTDSIVAPVLMHAICNLLVIIAARGY